MQWVLPTSEANDFSYCGVSINHSDSGTGNDDPCHEQSKDLYYLQSCLNLVLLAVSEQFSFPLFLFSKQVSEISFLASNKVGSHL